MRWWRSELCSARARTRSAIARAMRPSEQDHEWYRSGNHQDNLTLATSGGWQRVLQKCSHHLRSCSCQLNPFQATVAGRKNAAGHRGKRALVNGFALLRVTSSSISTRNSTFRSAAFNPAKAKLSRRAANQKTLLMTNLGQIASSSMCFAIRRTPCGDYVSQSPQDASRISSKPPHSA